MYKFGLSIETLRPRSRCKKNRPCVVVDQTPAKDFNVNEFGHIRSDVTALMQASTEELYKLAASRLNELPLSQIDTSNMTDEQIVGSVVGRSMQLPSEIAAVATRFARRAMAAEPPASVASTSIEPPSDSE